MPNVEGSLNTGDTRHPERASVTGCFKREGTTTSGSGYSDATTGYLINFDASRSNPIYGSSETVTPESLSTKFFIKF